MTARHAGRRKTWLATGSVIVATSVTVLLSLLGLYRGAAAEAIHSRAAPCVERPGQSGSGVAGPVDNAACRSFPTP
jgi:hypothetical protein